MRVRKLVSTVMPVIVGVIIGHMCLAQTSGGGTVPPCPDCGTSCKPLGSGCLGCCDMNCSSDPDLHFNCTSGCCR